MPRRPAVCLHRAEAVFKSRRRKKLCNVQKKFSVCGRAQFVCQARGMKWGRHPFFSFLHFRVWEIGFGATCQMRAAGPLFFPFHSLLQGVRGF